MTAGRSDCSGLPGRTSLRRLGRRQACRGSRRLFRSSRPDFIETQPARTHSPARQRYCSGLPGRTSLRLVSPAYDTPGLSGLFRSSRPDFIETSDIVSPSPSRELCSGLPGRTSLRRVERVQQLLAVVHCFGLPGRSLLRRAHLIYVALCLDPLFRSSRPDFIETTRFRRLSRVRSVIVPVFQAGLH